MKSSAVSRLAVLGRPDPDPPAISRFASLAPHSLPDPNAPAQRLALPVAAIVAAFTFTMLQLLHRLYAGTGADFRAMLRGASDLATGKDLYAPALHFLSGGHLRGILDMHVTLYVYPPPLAIIMRPLTLLPPAWALLLWDLLNVSLAGLIFVLVVRVSRARSLRDLVLVGAMYGFFPLNMGLGTGQIDLTLSVLCFLTFLLYRAGCGRRAGLLLGLAVLVKPTLGIVALFFLCRRAWTVLSAFGATVVAGVGVSLLAAGGTVLWEYRQVALGWTNAFGVLPLNQSLQGVVLRMLSPRLDLPPTGRSNAVALVIEIALVLAAVALVAGLLRHPEPRGLREGSLQYYAAFSLLLLGIPFTENLHFTWILPGVGILFVIMNSQRGWRPWHALAVAAYLWLAFPFAEMISWRADSSLLGRLASGVECYGLLALACSACYAAFAGLSHSGMEAQPALTLRRSLAVANRRGA